VYCVVIFSRFIVIVVFGRLFVCRCFELVKRRLGDDGSAGRWGGLSFKWTVICSTCFLFTLCFISIDVIRN